MSVAVLVPWQYEPGRQHGFRIVNDYLQECFPFWPRYISHSGQHFSRGLSLQLSAKKMRAEVLVFHDADSLVPPAHLEQAVELARKRDALVWAYTHYLRLDERTSAEIEHWSQCEQAEPFQTLECPPSLGVAAISTANYFRAGGYDERFRGWGYEDSALIVACDRAGLEQHRIPGPLWHLWHPPAPGSDLSDVQDPQTAANLALFEQEYAHG